MSNESEKSLKREKIRSRLRNQSYNVVDEDFTKPWGGYFRIDNAQTAQFIAEYFPDIEIPFDPALPISPKILIVEQGRQLSWQLHHRRGEFWRVVDGPAGVFLSPADDLPDQYQTFLSEQTINIPVGTRHRLVGVAPWTIVAELWLHTDPTNPSDESDIIRLADDFGR